MSKLSWAERSLVSVWHPCTQMKWLDQHPPLSVVRASGAWLYDEQGRRYLDTISSWWVNLFGHCYPPLMEAITRQLYTLDHVMLAGATHPPVVTLSEELSALTGNELGHCFYGSDGASAIEIALKMSVHAWRAQGYSKKNQFITFKGGYHGETIGALGVTSIGLFREAYQDMIRPAIEVPSPDSRLGVTSETFSLQSLEEYLALHHEEVAAVILEPLVQAAAGMIFHSTDYVRQVAELCRQYGVYWIADEIAVGFGRTGTLFAHESAQVRPDFLCLSKGITGGTLPLSVVMTRDEIYRVFYRDRFQDGFLHSHSYTGNPLACRAAVKVLQLFREEQWIARNHVNQERWNVWMNTIEQHARVRHFRQKGMIWAFDFDGAPPDFSQRFHEKALAYGLLIRPIGTTVYWMPPYCLTDEEVQFLVQGILNTLEEF